MSKRWNDLSIRDRRIVDYFLRDMSLTKIAYYTKLSKKTLSRKKSELKLAIEDRMAMLDSQRVLKVEEALSHMTDIAIGTVQEQVMFKGDLIDKEVAIKDRLKALELIAKHHGAFVEKIEIKETPKIEIEIVKSGGDNED